MISKIAYNCCGDSYSTSSILVGTTCGCVYETKLCVSGPSPRLSLRLRLEEATAISGLQLNVIIPSLHHESPLFFVLISTTPPHSRLYYISGDTSRARSVTHSCFRIMFATWQAQLYICTLSKNACCSIFLSDSCFYSP